MVHGGARRSQYGETSEAIFLTQGFVYPDAATAEARFIAAGPDEFIYARYGNPTVRMFEERMATLEGAEDAFATASGMAAVHGALFSQLRAGDHVVSARALFGSLPLHRRDAAAALRRRGHASSTAPTSTSGARRSARTPRRSSSRSISNPTLEVIDIGGGRRARARRRARRLDRRQRLRHPGLPCAASSLGADVVIYSATKHIDGQGRCLGGVVLGSRDFIRGPLEPFLKHTGGALSPFNAWVMLKGLETLDLRCRAQAASAAASSPAALHGHPALARVIYPGLPDHPQAELSRAADGDRRHHAVARSRRRQGGRLPLPRRARDRADLEQPRRLQEPRHPPGDDHPPAAERRAARRARHRRRAGPALGRARGSGGPPRRPARQALGET